MVKHTEKPEHGFKNQSPVADPVGVENGAEQLATLGQAALMWRKFRKHRLAMVGGVITLVFYVVVLLAEFLAPYPTDQYFSNYPYAPPQRIRLFHETESGTRWLPHVLGYQVTVDTESFAREFVPDSEQVIPIGLFVRGAEYEWLGII